MTTSKIIDETRSYVLITLGLTVYAIGWTAFLIPAEITGGGVSGIGALIYFATGFPVGATYLIVNAFLVLLAIRILGASFGVKTIYGIGIVSILLWVFQSVFTEPFVDDVFMSTLLGGILSGAGIGLALSNGGNSGGTDIIALIINKYREISPGRIIMYIDIVIIASSYLVLGSIEKIVYGYVSIAVFSYALDAVLEGARQSYQIMIFSDQNELIAERISKEIGRGVTSFKGYGWYTKRERDVLIVVARKFDRPKIMQVIKETDPGAFITIAKVMGVYGKGFDHLKI